MLSNEYAQLKPYAQGLVSAFGNTYDKKKSGIFKDKTH